MKRVELSVIEGKNRQVHDVERTAGMYKCVKELHCTYDTLPDNLALDPPPWMYEAMHEHEKSGSEVPLKFKVRIMEAVEGTPQMEHWNLIAEVTDKWYSTS
jgi:hypothetical protein